MSNENEVVIFTTPKDRSKSPLKKVVKSLDEISSEFSKFQKQMSSILEKMDSQDSSFHLEEVSITAEISAEGELGFLGVANAKAGAKGGITFRFTRKKAK
jgi:hypothetical protein